MKLIFSYFNNFKLKNLAVADAIRTSLGPKGMDKMVIKKFQFNKYFIKR